MKLATSSVALLTQDRVQILNDLKSVIQTGVHHCNNQLAGILSAGDLILVMNDPEVTAKKLESIRRRASVIADTLSALYCFSQIDSVHQKEIFLVKDFCQKALSNFSSQLQQHKIETSMEIKPNLQIHTCSNTLHKIFEILIQNAIDALTGETHRIKILIDSDKDKTSLKIKDSGPALEAEVMEKVFNPFFSTKPGKVGQGLTEARTLIRMLGGDLQFYRDGAYNCAHITIPKSEVFDAKYL